MNKLICGAWAIAALAFFPMTARAQTSPTAVHMAQIAPPAAATQPTCLFAFLAGVPTCLFLDPSVVVIAGTGNPVIRAVIPAGALPNLVFGESYPSTGTTYQLAHLPVAGTVRMYLNGLRNFATVDYTIAGQVVTLLRAPDAGGLVAFDYEF